MLFQKRNPGSVLWPDIFITQIHTYISLTPEKETEARDVEEPQFEHAVVGIFEMETLSSHGCPRDIIVQALAG